MPFVLPLNDLDAENARLLDRLTKQQEENQSLRAENAKLKAENQSLRLENDQKLNWATTADAKADKLESELAEHKRIAEKRAKDMRELFANMNKLKEDFAGWKASYDDDIREARAEGIDELGAKVAMKDKIIDRLREEKYQLGLMKDRKHKAEVEMLKRQQCDTEYELTYYKGYIENDYDGWKEFAEHLSGGIKGSDVGINWGWLEDDFNQFSVVYYDPDPITGEQNEIKTTMIRDKNEIQDIDNPTPEELEEHKEFFSDSVLGATIKSMELIKVYDLTEE